MIPRSDNRPHVRTGTNHCVFNSTHKMHSYWPPSANVTDGFEYLFHYIGVISFLNRGKTVEVRDSESLKEYFLGIIVSARS